MKCPWIITSRGKIEDGKRYYKIQRMQKAIAKKEAEWLRRQQEVSLIMKDLKF